MWEQREDWCMEKLIKIKPWFLLLKWWYFNKGNSTDVEEYNDLEKPAIIVGATSHGNEVTYGEIK